MLTSLFVLASVATLVQNVVHNKTTNLKLNKSVRVTTTTPETDLHVNVTSTTSNADIDFLFDEPEEPTVNAVVSPVTYGAGPHWSNETQTLYYVSIFGKTLMKHTEGSHFKAKLDGMPTFIIPIEGKMNTFAVGLDQKVVEIQWDGAFNGTKVLRTIAEVHMEHPEDRFSHGKADPRGRLFAGSMSNNNDPGRTNKKHGALYRFAEDGTPQKVLNNIDVSNGLCWDLAHKAFYLIDNFNYSIRRYDYDVETGHISNPQIVFSMQDQEYIVANARSYGQVYTQYDLPYDIFEPNNLGGPQGSAPGGPQGSAPGAPQDYVKSGPPIGRQGNTQDYDQGTQGDPQDSSQSLEIYKNLGGLLDRDDYYENGYISSPETDATGGGDDEASGGSEGVAPGGSESVAPGGSEGAAPSDSEGVAPGGSKGVAPGGSGYVKGDHQIRRQGDLQVFAQGGPQSASQSPNLGGLQDYGQSGPDSNGQGEPEVAAPGSSESDDPGSTQGIAHGASQGASHGAQGHAPGSPQSYALSGAQAYAPRGHVPVSPGILRTGTATVQDYYYQGLAQDGLQGAPPGGPESNTTGNFLNYVRDGPQDQAPGGPLDHGPEDFHGFAPGGHQGYPPRSSIRTKGVEKGDSYKKKLSGTLDGMTIDTEGNLWVANYNGSQVLKIDPKKGKLLLVIPVETLLVTSVTFGGPELDVLYVTSAATDRMDKKEQRSPAGSTFSIMNTGAKGHLNNNVRFTQSIKTR